MLVINHNFSSLVVDTVMENGGVACFYFDFAAPEEQSPAAVLGSVLKQIVGGRKGVPKRIVEAFQERGKVIGGRKLLLLEIVELLQDISSSRGTFICIDALEKCQERHRIELLDSLYQILRGSPGARIFVTGRPSVRAEVEKHLPQRVATRSITATRGDITLFLRAKLRADAMLDAMDESLEEEILKAIPEIASEK